MCHYDRGMSLCCIHEVPCRVALGDNEQEREKVPTHRLKALSKWPWPIILKQRAPMVIGEEPMDMRIPHCRGTGIPRQKILVVRDFISMAKKGQV